VVERGGILGDPVDQEAGGLAAEQCRMPDRQPGQDVRGSRGLNFLQVFLGLFGVDFDPQLVITPAPHFAFTAGPAVDIGFAGSASQTTPGAPGGNCNSSTTLSGGYSSYNIGLTGALTGWF